MWISFQAHVVHNVSEQPLPIGEFVSSPSVSVSEALSETAELCRCVTCECLMLAQSSARAQQECAEPEPVPQKQTVEEVPTPTPDAAKMASKEEVEEVVEEPRVAKTDEVDAPTRGKRDKVTPPPTETEETVAVEVSKPQVAQSEGK